MSHALSLLYQSDGCLLVESDCVLIVVEFVVVFGSQFQEGTPTTKRFFDVLFRLEDVFSDNLAA